MTDKDKLEKVRAEIERRRDRHSKAKRIESALEDNAILSFIDSMQKEPTIPDIVDEHYWEMLGAEPVSEIDFEQELYKYFGQVKDFTLGMRIAKRFYEIGRNYQEPVSEDLERAAGDYEHNMWKEGHPEDTYNSSDIIKAVKFGVQWKEQQMIAKAVDGLVVCNNFTHGYKDILMEIPSYLNVDDEVKVIIIKED